MRGSLGGFIIGIILLMLAIFLTTLIRQVFPSLSNNSADILSMVILFMGIVAVFIGFRARGS
jgi:uncharacterized membrane protein